jgi:hypothetical protein
MIICPNCQHKEMTGALYCSQCGTQLVDATRTNPKTLSVKVRQELQHEQGKKLPIPPANVRFRISLNIVDSGQILPLADRSEFTLGRSAEGQPIIPDVDLSPFNAYSNGVSRLHAVLKYPQERPMIMDLGSSNGTYLNGKRLVPYIDTPIDHGDNILLGKLKIQVLLT